MAERLQKIMARAGIGSRRHNETLIREGRVRLNGQVARLGDTADPEKDEIIVDGRPLNIEKPVYIMLNKPRNVLSSTEDELGQGRRTVRDIVDVPGHLYPVGRLDKQSIGLMLLTNDGELAHRLTHPRYGHEKVYRVKVEGQPTPATLAQWRQGVELDGERTRPVRIKVEKTNENETWLLITMREGRKRQIRRVAAQLGHPVLSLARIQLGPLHLGNLELGQWRHLTAGEVNALRRSIRRKEKRPEQRPRPQPQKKRRFGPGGKRRGPRRDR